MYPTAIAQPGVKADLYLMREGDALRVSAFRRRILVDYGPPIGHIFVHCLEDLILYKLIYFGISGQPKHIRDITAILKANRDKFDFEYVENRVVKLGLGSTWKELKSNIE